MWVIANRECIQFFNQNETWCLKNKRGGNCGWFLILMSVHILPILFYLVCNLRTEYKKEEIGLVGSVLSCSLTSQKINVIFTVLRRSQRSSLNQLHRAASGYSPQVLSVLKSQELNLTRKMKYSRKELNAASMVLTLEIAKECPHRDSDL